MNEFYEDFTYLKREKIKSIVRLFCKKRRVFDGELKKQIAIYEMFF